MELATNENVGVKRVTKEVWAIIPWGERGDGAGGERDATQRKSWRKLGVAWENRDGSLKVVLDTVPLGPCDIVIRDPKPFDEARRPLARPFG